MKMHEKSDEGGDRAAAALPVSAPRIFMSLAPACLSLKQAGCVLAWCFFNRLWHVTEGEEWLGYLRGIQQAVRRGLAKRGRALFPFTLGPLSRLEGVFRGVPLSHVQDGAFVMTESEDAWVFCALLMLNSLSSVTTAMEKGRWTKLQQRGAEEVRGSVRRMLKLDEECPRS